MGLDFVCLLVQEEMEFFIDRTFFFFLRPM